MGGCSSSEQNSAPPLLVPARRKKDLTYKVVLLGDTAVGKTSILNYVLSNSKVSGEYSPTIGFAFSSKAVTLPCGETVTLQIWDTSGQDTYRELVSLYYRDSQAAILVFDYTSKSSINSLVFWLRQLEERVSTQAMVLKLAGNKADLRGSPAQEVEPKMIEDALEEIAQPGLELLDTSALTGQNIEELFQKIAQECYDKFR